MVLPTLSIFEVFRRRDHTFDREDLQLLCLELATGEIPADDTSGSPCRSGCGAWAIA